MKDIEKFAVDFLLESAQEIKALSKKGLGREIVGTVEGRSTDLEIGIDGVAEKILERKLNESNFKIAVFSEHNNFGVDVDQADYFIALDPFDGSLFFRTGLPFMWYVALGIFDKNARPVFSGIVDISTDKLYFTKPDGSYVRSLDDNKEKKLQPSSRKISNKNFTLASYLMKRKRLENFSSKYKDLLESLTLATFIYPNGGPSNYAYLAEGIIDVYLVVNEPRLEVDTGYFIAQKANCLITQINDNNTIEEYKFIPGKQNERVNLIVSANKNAQDKILPFVF